MARITVEDCLTKETNRFALVLLAAKRTKQILRGSPIVIEDKRDNKSVVTSLREIASGKVRFKTEADLAIEREEAEKRRAAELAAREKSAELVEQPSSGEDDSGNSDGESDSDSESGGEKVPSVESTSLV